MKRQQRYPHGITLAEVLVVVAVIVLLLALLLPSLRRAEFQANVSVCRMTLRNLGVAVTSYAGDFNQTYPVAADPPDLGITPSWLYAEWQRSWEWKRRTSFTDPVTGETRTYDLRPVYREYLGTDSLNTAAKCPLASPWFQKTDIDKHWLSNYMLYMTNNPRTKHFYMEVDDAMHISSKMNRTWSTSNDPDVEYRLIASDMNFASGIYGYGNGAVTGHPAPQGYDREAGGPINDFPGYGIGKLGEPLLTAPINFLDGDLSVHTFAVNAESRFHTNDWARVYNANYLLPLDLARQK